MAYGNSINLGHANVFDVKLAVDGDLTTNMYLGRLKEQEWTLQFKAPHMIFSSTVFLGSQLEGQNINKEASIQRVYNK